MIRYSNHQNNNNTILLVVICCILLCSIIASILFYFLNQINNTQAKLPGTGQLGNDYGVEIQITSPPVPVAKKKSLENVLYDLEKNITWQGKVG